MSENRMGLFITKQREKLGMSTADLAKGMDVSVRRVKLWEKGKEFPKNEEVDILANILQVDLEELMACESNPGAGEAALGTLEYMEDKIHIAKKNLIVAYVAIWITYIMFVCVDHWLGISWAEYIFRLALGFATIYGAAGIARLS